MRALSGLVVLFFVNAAGAATMVVDGVGGAGHYSTLTAALAELDRHDGEADVIRITAATIRETNTVAIGFREGNTDALTIEGAAPEGKAPVLIFTDNIGENAIEITGMAASRLRLKHLILVPTDGGMGTPWVKDFPHGGIRIRFEEAPGNPVGAGHNSATSEAQIALEDISITAVVAGGAPSDPEERIGPYTAHTRWKPGTNSVGALFVIEGSGGSGTVELTRCRAGHSGRIGFLLRQGRGLRVELSSCTARFGAQDGFRAQGCDGESLLRQCEASWNDGMGFMFASGEGRLELDRCRFTANRERGLQVGFNGSAAIPPNVRIRGGSFSENGWTDYNLGAAGKYEYGILIWGGTATTLDFQGTAEEPLLVLDNFRRGLRIDNGKARLEQIQYAVFAGRHRESGLDLTSLDFSVRPTIRHCAFVANAWQSYYHSQLTIAAENSAPAAVAIEDCTFYNAAGGGSHHIAVENFNDRPTRNLRLDIRRCIFAGGPAGRGTDERALYLDGINCAAELRDCALVTEGPYALNAQYIEANLAGHGNEVRETNCVHADPNFAPSRCTRRLAADYAAVGMFLRPQSTAYVAAHTPGGVDLGGYSLQPAPDAPVVQPVRVAVYADQGPDRIDLFQTTRILQGCTDVTYEEIKARDIWTGCLGRFDVVMFPGGSSSAEANSLKSKGRALVRDFVDRGGGYIGTCAGAYLIMASENHSDLDFLPARCVDGEHWARGHGIVQIRLTPEGRRILGGEEAVTEIEYWQGPLLVPVGTVDRREYLPLATYVTEIHENGAAVGVMPGTSAMVAGRHGAGRYLAISCHPEAVITPLFKGDYVYQAVLWAAGRKPDAVGQSQNTLRTALARLLTEQFAGWDQDHDGTLSGGEMDVLVADPAVKGNAAAAVAALKRASRSTRLKLPLLTLSNLVAMTGSTPTPPVPDLVSMYSQGLSRISNAACRALFASGQPRLETMHQGKLGNCYCLAPLGAMVHRSPAQVMGLFQEQSNGTYCVILGTNRVCVTAPTDAELAMTSSNERDGVWVNLYEKAIGQARLESHPADQRSKSALDALARGGSAGTMLSFITGHEIRRFSFKFAKDGTLPPSEREAQLADLRRQLAAATRGKLLMTCGTLKTTTRGLTPNHAYGILDYDSTTDGVRLWNPHGQNFTPKDPPGLENGYLTKDGIFTVPVVELVRQFSGMAFEVAGSGDVP